MDLTDLREHYSGRGLRRRDLLDDPIDQFETWFTAMADSDYWEPNAMVVSTVDAEGWPAARNVLLKSFDTAGFVFYTNYASAKAAALDETGRAALTFSWIEVLRQVRIVGTVERTTAAESDAYFAGRPRRSQLGAWASDQSAVLADRDQLEARLAEVTERFDGHHVPRPPDWGGYRVGPVSVEFWQGRSGRLHDRFVYTRAEDGWTIDRLHP